MLAYGSKADPTDLTAITTAKPGVVGVLQLVSKLILMIHGHMGQRRGYTRMTHGSSRRDTVWYICYKLDVRYTYASTRRTNIGLLRRWILTSWLKAY
jgi:hypothetical protein